MFFAKKVLGSRDILYLGNLNAKEIGDTQKIIQKCNGKFYSKKSPDDYIIATGKTTSVRDFVNECCKYLKLKIIWVGKGTDEKAYLVKNGKKEN